MSLPKLNPKRYTLNALKGFTLIELLVVISIIAILTAVATVSYVNAQEKGRDNKRKSDLKAVQQALEMYFNQNGQYPEQHTGGLLRCVGAASGLSWGTMSFACGSPGITYMNPLPRDPIVGTDTQYFFHSDNASVPPNQTYKIFARIENTRDQDMINAISDCNSDTPGPNWANPFYYCVINP